MQKTTIGFFAGMQVVAWTVVAAVALHCGPPLKSASVELINDAESQWRDDSVSSYTIVVDVEGPEGRRRNEISVSGGQIIQASTRFWDSGGWGDQKPLNQAQALPFTVPGLFETIREEIQAGQRSAIRVSFHKKPSYIQLAVLGPRNDGKNASGSTYIRVMSFRLSPPPAGS